FEMDHSDLNNEVIDKESFFKQEGEIASRAGITKRKPLEVLHIPDAAFNQASRLSYGKQAGFVWRIQDKYSDKNGGVYKYVFECHHAGKFLSKKTATNSSNQRNRNSIKTSCTCFINICWPFKSSGLTITKLNLTHHGHTLNPDTIHFANIYRQLPQNIMNKIEFYINMISNISQHTLRQLLQGEFKDQLFLNKDLANTIQRFRKGNIMDNEQDPENDASNLLKQLQRLKENDPMWFISYHSIEIVLPTTRYLHCIFHIIQNLKKHLTRPLGSRYKEFQTDLFSCRNTLFETIFESRFELLYTNYPEASSYLRTTLYPIKYRWAKCFTFQDFNAGMSSTQRVKSINAIIHKFVNSHSTLMECFNGIQNLLAAELQKAEYRDYLANLPFSITSSSAVRIFPNLVEKLKEILTDEKSDPSDCLEDAIDKCQIALNYLINRINIDNIVEIWKVKHMATNIKLINYVALCQDYSHISLLKNRWYKKGVDIDNINTIYDSFGIYKQTDAEIKNSTLIS
ncbi:6036_t:CDS:2, partial [Funneliformis caledonium]